MVEEDKSSNIFLWKSTIRRLKTLKTTRRESYDEIVNRLIDKEERVGGD